jgi:RNA polymerase sigma-70 factor (ECF subfamily)
MTSVGYETYVREAQTAETEAEKHAAFDALNREFQDQAYRWAISQLGDPQMAQDAAQEAFIAAYENIDQQREPDAFPAWLRRIVISQCHRQMRQKMYANTRTALDEDAAYSSDESLDNGDPAQTIEERELARDIRRALDQLPAHERSVTELYYLTGYSQQEIAEQLALPITTVKKRLQYAREHLRETLPTFNAYMMLDYQGDDVLEWVFMFALPSQFKIMM